MNNTWMWVTSGNLSELPSVLEVDADSVMVGETLGINRIIFPSGIEVRINFKSPFLFLVITYLSTPYHSTKRWLHQTGLSKVAISWGE